MGRRKRLHPVCRHIHFEAGFGREEAIDNFDAA
jgi:hypothetical protein